MQGHGTSPLAEEGVGHSPCHCERGSKTKDSQEGQCLQVWQPNGRNHAGCSNENVDVSRGCKLGAEELEHVFTLHVISDQQLPDQPLMIGTELLPKDHHKSMF